MLNESKVKLMTRMAMYESKQGEEDFKISSYYKKDYREASCYMERALAVVAPYFSDDL